MKARRVSIWEELELGFGCSKLRVIMHLLRNPKEAYTRYAIVKATGLRTSTVESQLERLVEIGWVVKHKFTPATYQANMENEAVREVYSFIQKVKRLRRSRPAE